MLNEKKRPAQSKNEAQDIMTFNFAESQTEIRSLIVENEPWLVAKDICDILELGNVTKALYALDNDEKLTLPIVTSGQKRNVNCINESGLYTLIMKSRKPEAKVFRKWVTSEVLPAIRKKGYYKNPSQPTAGSFVDARDMPYHYTTINAYNVRYVSVADITYYSIADIHRAINSSTSPSQTVKQLNKKKPNAIKIWLFGNTHPAWFTTLHGLQLVVSGSRILKDVLTQQNTLPFEKEVYNA